ncbi:MAG: MarR family transcriptional regulator [Patulibacter sp.]|nr:MarR family transcriptional regulator [Patulibacter sp.]
MDDDALPLDADAAFAPLERELKRLMAGLRRARGHGNQYSRGLTMAQYQFVEALIDADEPIAVGALAEHAGLTRPSATTTARALEEGGIVERSGDPRDARVVRLALTAEGRRQASERRAEQHEWRRQIASAVGLADLAPGARVLAAISDQIEAYVAAQAGSDGVEHALDDDC